MKVRVCHIWMNILNEEWAPKLLTSFPKYFWHAFIADTIPDEIDSTYPSTPVI